MRKRVTLKDIAKIAGVHVSTVSRALDSTARYSLTPEVVNRINSIASELGYEPNRVAYGLRTNRSMSIGIMIPDITDILFPPLIRGIESVLEPLGYTGILVNTDEDPERERHQIGVLRQHGVDGLISGAAHRDDPALLRVFEQGLPLVTMTRRLDNPKVPYVINDEEDGFRKIIAHLYSLGHREISFVSGPLNLSTGHMRLQAVKRNCASQGMELKSEDIVVANRFDESEGRRSTLDLLNSGSNATAIVCANDRLAIGAYAALREFGLSIPGDISVTGFNDNPLLEMIPPGLTTIRIHQFEAGATCARVLLQLLQALPPEKQGTVLPVKLICRESTGIRKLRD